MELNVYKALSALLLFLVAFLGACLAGCAARLSPRLVRLSNAAAGGVLLAVTLVHMLSESGEQLEGPGREISRALSHSDAPGRYLPTFIIEPRVAVREPLEPLVPPLVDPQKHLNAAHCGRTARSASAALRSPSPWASRSAASAS